MNLSLQNASNVPLIILLSRGNTYVTETLLNLLAPGLWPGICCVLVKKINFICTWQEWIMCILSRMLYKCQSDQGD